MNRPSPWVEWIGCLCFAAAASADDVTVSKLIPFAEFSLYIPVSPGVSSAWRNHAADSENRPTRTGRIGHVMLADDSFLSIAEYRVISDWVASHNDHVAPEYLDMVAVLENRGEVAVGPIQVDLYRDRKVGETAEAACEAPLTVPHPNTQAVWQGSVLVDTNEIVSLEGKTAIGVKFGFIPIFDSLLDDLTVLGLWPWEVKYEIRLQCTGCSPEVVSVSLPMGKVC